MNLINKYKISLSAFIIMSAYILFSMQHLLELHFFAPDADRICMDGVFLLDFFRDLPSSFFNIYTYTTEYYAKYPALSIGYRPIFFQLVLSVFYLFFGISYVSAKIAVFSFLLAGIYFWIKMVSQYVNYSTAILSTLFWLTNPFIFSFSQQPMLEIPTLAMVIISLYYLCKYEISPTRTHTFFLAISVGLTLWTNQKSWFVLLICMVYPLFKKNFRFYALKNTWWAAFIILIFFIPLIVLTIWLGDQNFDQSIGHLGENVSFFSKYRPFQHLIFLYQNHFKLPLIILSIIGIIICFIKKDQNILLFGIPIICIYLFFTLINVKVSRFTIYWIPFFCLFASIAVQMIYSSVSRVITDRYKIIMCLFFSSIVCFQLSFLPDIRIEYAKGYERAAKYVLERAKSPIILFYGYANGQFIFFARQHDPNRQFVILRGSKLIASSSVTMNNRLKIHLQSKQEIYKALHEIGVHFIVLESTDKGDLPIFKEFTSLLKDTTRFKLHKKIDIKSSCRRLNDKKLLIYENLNFVSLNKDRILELRLPIVGKTIKIKVDNIVSK